MNSPEKAEQKFAGGFNCAQSVFSVIAAELGFNEQLAEDISRAFGAGISYRAEMCGAVSGGLMAIGLKAGEIKGNETLKKELTLKYATEFMAKFKTLNGALYCKDLLGKDLSIPLELDALNAAGTFDKICPGLVKSSTEILVEILIKIDREHLQ